LATRTKAENYDSDDTLVDSEDEDAQLKARATTEELPSGFALDQMVHEAQKNGRPDDTTMAHSSHRCQNREIYGQRKVHSLLWETTP